MGEELIINYTQQPVAKIVSLVKSSKVAKVSLVKSSKNNDMKAELRKIISQPAKYQLRAATFDAKGFCFNREEANER